MEWEEWVSEWWWFHSQSVSQSVSLNIKSVLLLFSYPTIYYLPLSTNSSYLCRYGITSHHHTSHFTLHTSHRPCRRRLSRYLARDPFMIENQTWRGNWQSSKSEVRTLDSRSTLKLSCRQGNDHKVRKVSTILRYRLKSPNDLRSCLPTDWDGVKIDLNQSISQDYSVHIHHSSISIDQVLNTSRKTHCWFRILNAL